MNCPTCSHANADWRTQCEKCGTDLKQLVDQTSYPQALVQEQSKLPTRSSEISGGIGGLVLSFVFTGIMIAVILWIKSSDVDLAKTLGPVGILIGPVGIFAALIYPFTQLFRIGKGLFSAERTIACPDCGKNIKVLTSEKSFLCPTCAAVYRLPANENEIIKVTCPVCATHWMSTSNAGNVECHGCGAEMVIENGTVRPAPQTAHCPGCGQPTYSNSSACAACGALVVSRPIPDKPFLRSTGKFFTPAFNDTAGPKIPDGQNQLTIQPRSAYAALAQAQWQGRLVFLELEKGKQLEFTDSIKLITSLLKGISALNVALDGNPDYAKVALETLKKYDVLVGRILHAAVDPASGTYYIKTTFSGAGSYVTGQGKFSSDKQINETLFTASAEYNRLVKRLEEMTGAAVPLWPVPVFNIESSGAYTSVTFTVSDWQAALAQNRLVQIPKEEPLPVFAMPV